MLVVADFVQSTSPLEVQYELTIASLAVNLLTGDPPEFGGEVTDSIVLDQQQPSVFSFTGNANDVAFLDICAGLCAAPIAEVEPNDDTATAQSVAVPNVVESAIATRRRVRLLRRRRNCPVTLTISTAAGAGAALGDSLIWLLGTDGTTSSQRRRTADPGCTARSPIRLIPVVPTFVRVAAFGATSTGTTAVARLERAGPALGSGLRPVEYSRSTTTPTSITRAASTTSSRAVSDCPPTAPTASQ